MSYHELKHEALTGRIIGAAMKVHRYLGPGFPEAVYQKSLTVELKKEGLGTACECSKDIHYEGIHVGSRRLDMLVEDKVLVELKAITQVDPVFYTQVINYLRIFDLEVGLLLNFGKPSLEFKRFVNSKYFKQDQGNLSSKTNQ